MSNLKATAIVAGLFIIVALILLLVIPAFKGSEVAAPTKAVSDNASTTAVTTAATTTTANSTTAVAPQPSATPSPLPTSTEAPTPTIPASTATLAPTATAVTTTTTIVRTLATNTPQVTQQPFNLPKGIGPSDGALSCPNPLPVEKIRSDYLAYWQALVRAYRENNPEILKPFVDQQARDGKYWEGEQQAIQKTVQGGYYLDYQIEHTNQLVVKINPTFGGPGQCQVAVYDGVKLTVLAKKIGTDEPFDKANDKPFVQQYTSDHYFTMIMKDGKWIISGEGSGSL